MPWRDGGAHRIEPRRPAVQQDLAGVRLLDPGQDLHQRALAGAVLADHGQHFAACQTQVDLGQRLDAGEAFADARGLPAAAASKRVAHGRRWPLRILAFRSSQNACTLSRRICRAGMSM